MALHDLLTIGGTTVSPAEIIKRYRRNMIVHSYIYYRMDDNIISDHQWQDMANTLMELQEAFPEPIGYYDDLFKDWDGSTGNHLTYETDNSYWVAEALYLVRLYQSHHYTKDLESYFEKN